MPLSGVLKITPSFHGQLKASLKPLSGVIKLTLPIETPVIHVSLSGRVGGTLPHKSYSSLSWVGQTAKGRLRGPSPRSGFAVIGSFEPMSAGAGTAPPRCHPPPDGGTLRHVNNSLPGPLSEGSVHGNGSRQPDNWRSALAEPFVTVLAHGNGVINSPKTPMLIKPTGKPPGGGFCNGELWLPHSTGSGARWLKWKRMLCSL